jgi:hypothetical protein
MPHVPLISSPFILSSCNFPHHLLFPLSWVQTFPSLFCSQTPRINYVISLWVTENISHPCTTTDKICWGVMVKAYKHKWCLNKLWADFSFFLYSYHTILKYELIPFLFATLIHVFKKTKNLPTDQVFLLVEVSSLPMPWPNWSVQLVALLKNKT